MSARRLRRLATMLARRNAPVSPATLADFREVWPARLPKDYFDFLRIANGGTGEPGPLARLAHLHALEDVPAQTADYGAPKGTTVIGGNGIGAAYLYDTRRGRNAFVVANYTDFRPQQVLGKTFLEFLEAILKAGPAGGGGRPASPRKAPARPAPHPARPRRAPASPPAPATVTGMPTPASALPRPANAPAFAVSSAPLTYTAKPAGPALALKLDSLSALQSQLALSPDGRLAAFIMLGTQVAVYDLATAKLVYKGILAGYEIAGITFSPDAARLLAACAPKYGSKRVPPTVVELPGDAPRLTSDARVARAAFSADATRVALQCEHAGGTFSVCVRDLATGRYAFPPAACDRGPIALSADGSRLAARAPGTDGLLLFDLPAGTAVSVPDARSDYFALSPAGRLALVNRFDLRVVDAATGKTRRQIPTRLRGPLACRFVDDARALVATSTGSLHLYNVLSGKELARYEMIKRPGDVELTVSPDGRTALLAAERSRVLTLYRLPA